MCVMKSNEDKIKYKIRLYVNKNKKLKVSRKPPHFQVARPRIELGTS